MIDLECDDLKWSIKHWDEKHKGRVLAVGSCGLWYGRAKDGKIYKNLEDAVYSLVKDTNTLYTERKKRNTTIRSNTP